MKILAVIPLKTEQAETLEAAGHEVIPPEQLDANNAKTIDVMYWWDASISPKVDLDHLQYLQTISAGVDYLPLKALADHHVLVANTSGIHAEPIAESVVGMILALGRGILTSAVAGADQWQDEHIRDNMQQLEDKSAVIFGTGHIGQRIATKLSALGLTVYGVSAHGRTTSPFTQVVTTANWTDIGTKADFVINALPLTDETRGLFDEQFFGALKKHPVFVNIGRGPSVKTAALIAALNAKQLSAAALDVTDPEPLPSASPLWTMSNVLLTPHISGTVDHLRDKVFAIFLPNLNALVQHGQLADHQVDLTAGY